MINSRYHHHYPGVPLAAHPGEPVAQAADLREEAAAVGGAEYAVDIAERGAEEAARPRFAEPAGGGGGTLTPPE